MKIQSLMFSIAAIIGIVMSSCKNDVVEPELLPTVAADSSNIWNGPTITFTKNAGADPTDASNQDRITDNVWITRGNSGGQIFNAQMENSSTKSSSPSGTLWAIGTIDNIESLDFKPFREALNKPKFNVGKDLVLFLVEEKVYLSVKITAWSGGKSGGFSYERSTKP